MEAVAQEAAESVIPHAPEVWGVVSQWPILLLFLAGFAFAYWLFVVRKKDDNSSRIEALLRHAEQITHSSPGVNVDFGRIEGMFETMMRRLDKMSDDIAEGTRALAEHIRDDGVGLSDIRERLARMEGPRDVRTPDRRETQRGGRG